MDAVEDIGTQIVATFGLPDDEKRLRGETLAAGPIPLYLSRLRWRPGDFERWDETNPFANDLKDTLWPEALRRDFPCRYLDDLSLTSGCARIHSALLAFFTL